MLVDEIFKSVEEPDTSAYKLVDMIVERKDSIAWDSRFLESSVYVVEEKKEIKNIRQQIHFYNIDEEQRKKKVIEEREQVQSLISKMNELQISRSYDECMYQVYRHFKKWVTEDSFSRCDYVLKCISIDDFDIHILISLLMASYQMKNRLSYRSVFYEKVLNKARITYTSEDIQRIFGGLK